MRAWVKTENVHSTSTSPFEPFPDKPHLYYLTEYWKRSTRLLIPKSRQLTVTWWAAAMTLHHCMFWPSRLAFWQSKKEVDADATLGRIEVMYRNLPKFMREWQPLTGGKKTYCHMRFQRNRSHIWAIPAGADHARQYTSSLHVGDELAFQEEVENLMAAVGPTLKTKGRFVGISSAAPSYYELMVFDKTR